LSRQPKADIRRGKDVTPDHEREIDLLYDQLLASSEERSPSESRTETLIALLLNSSREIEVRSQNPDSTTRSGGADRWQQCSAAQNPGVRGAGTSKPQRTGNACSLPDFDGSS
jgi:hypothetical protein